MGLRRPSGKADTEGRKESAAARGLLVGSAARRSRDDTKAGASGCAASELPWLPEGFGTFGQSPSRLVELKGEVDRGDYDVRSDVLAAAILARLGIH